MARKRKLQNTSEIGIPDPNAMKQLADATNNASNNNNTNNQTSTQDASRPKTTVEHSSDGNVKVTVDGVSNTLSRKEFKNFTDIKKAKAQGRDITGSGIEGTKQQDILNRQEPKIADNNQVLAGIGQNVPELQGDSNAGEKALAIGTGLTGITSGAIAGAAAGSVVPVLGTAAGAVIGGAIGGVSSLLGKISVEQRQDATQAFNNYNNAKGNINKIIQWTNQGLMTPEEAVVQYNQEIANVNLAERQLKELTDSSLDRFLSGGKDELADIEAFRRVQWLYERRLTEAIVNPNPNAVDTSLLQNTNA